MGHEKDWEMCLAVVAGSMWGRSAGQRLATCLQGHVLGPWLGDLEQTADPSSWSPGHAAAHIYMPYSIV